MFKDINLPNKLTILRIILVPLFIIFMSLPTTWIWPLYVALGIFVVASITDFLDGRISRKRNIVTKFGKIMDPLADKLLVSSGFIMLTALNLIPGYITAIIIFRDFFVTSLRMFGADNGKDLAAGVSGKIKTIFQLIGVILTLVEVAVYGTGFGFLNFLTNGVNMSLIAMFLNVMISICLAVAVIATLVSLVDYFFKFKDDINVKE